MEALLASMKKPSTYREAYIQSFQNEPNIDPELANTPIGERCEDIVRAHGFFITFLPKECITREIVKLAIQTYGYALDYLPLGERDIELCEMSVEKYPRALCLVPMELRSIELCKKAVMMLDEPLTYVPAEHIPEIKKFLNIF